jgi:hypothetical protein
MKKDKQHWEETLDILILNCMKESRNSLSVEIMQIKMKELSDFVANLLLSQQQDLIAKIKESVPKKLPDKRGFYGKNDQLHIQSNIGFNQAIDKFISNLDKLK